MFAKVYKCEHLRCPLNTKIPSKFILRTFFNFILFLMGRFFYFFSICSASSTVLLSLPFSLRFFWFHQLASLYSLLWIFRWRAFLFHTLFYLLFSQRVKVYTCDTPKGKWLQTKYFRNFVVISFIVTFSLQNRVILKGYPIF